METLTQKSNGVDTIELAWGTFVCQIEGVVPLLLHSAQGVDPLNTFTQQKNEMKVHHSKKNEAWHLKMRKLDYMSSFYLNNDKEVIMPSENIYRCIQKSSGKPSTFAKGFDIIDDALLDYDGPRDAEALYESGNHMDYRKVTVNGNGIMRARPRFDKWGLTFQGMYNKTMINERLIRTAVSKAGSEAGLGDYRPRFGRFKVVSLKFI